MNMANGTNQNSYRSEGRGRNNNTRKMDTGKYTERREAEEKRLAEIYPWWENIKRIRKERDLTAAEVAKLVDLSLRSYQRLENKGMFLIDVETLLAICRVLRTTPNDILLGKK